MNDRIQNTLSVWKRDDGTSIDDRGMLRTNNVTVKYAPNAQKLRCLGVVFGKHALMDSFLVFFIHFSENM